ncbi:uncharacterized protein LOC125771679 [Anopheles funestus]|uniref:uncharacterized protein LOC125771679 n=1 Tax=Anopheles funestus TaxID=62324 RepID=UPI0020C63D82|nr:uncharacterized protein LOC125771679 [Anopheles funestus]
MTYLSVLVAFVVVLTMVSTVFAGRTLYLGREPPRTLQMIGSANPRMLHKISTDLQPDTSKVIHIQVPYYIERPKPRTKKFQPWVPRGQRFVSSSGPGSLQQHLASGPVTFGTPFPAREAPFKAKPILPNEFLANPGPYDTPFVPVMKPSPVNPLHMEQPAPEIMFEPISILPLESPSFATIRNHVNYLKQKQHAFFEGQGREFGLGGATIPDELEYFSEHEKRLGDGSVHNGDSDRTGGERNTLSEHDFGQNDRKYDRRGKAMRPVQNEEEEEESDEEDFYDSEGKQYQDDDFEDSRDETDRAAAFEPKKVYTQVRHREIVRHVPRSGREENVDENEEEDEEENENHEDGKENGKEESDKQDEDDEEDDEEEDGDHQERHHKRLPIRERLNLQRKNIVYSEKGHQADKFDHGSEESFGEFEQQEEPKPKRRNRIKRSTEETSAPAVSNRTLSDQIVDVLAMVILGNETLPLPEALTDPRELQGEELIKFLDEAIQNTTQYLPEGRLRDGEVISIVSPPSNVVKFPYYNRPASEIDVDSALRYAENLTSFSTGLYGAKSIDGVECNEVDVELEDEPEPIAEDTSGEGFKPIRRLKGLGDKIDCLKRKHFGSEPLDNPLFREEFVGVAPRKMYVGKGTTPAVPEQQKQQPQPNPAVAVYNDVIRHIKKHLASQQRRKNSKADTDQDTVMIAVPRILRLDRDDPELSGTHLKREARLAFPQANPLPVSNHISVPIFDISKFVPRFMMRPNEDLFAEQDHHVTTVRPRLSKPSVRLQTLVRTAEQLAEGAVSVEEGVEQILTTEKNPERDDIADAFDDVLAKPNQVPAPLPPIKPYSVVEKDTKDSGPEATFNKSGPPYTALALEPPVAQSILKQRIAPLERNHLDLAKPKRSPMKKIPRKSRRPSVTRKKVLVFYH